MPSPKSTKFIPEKSAYLPPDWNSPACRAMFARLKPKEVDPVAYNKKVEFWSDLVAKYCSVSKSAVADYETLKNSYKKEFLIPAPLEDVMVAMNRRGELQTLEEFTTKKGWVAWGLSFFNGGPQVDIRETVLAHIPTVEASAKLLKQLHLELRDDADDHPQVISFQDLKTKARSIIIDDYTFEFCIQQLIKWGDVIEGTSKSGDRVLKFVDEREKESGANVFTETDASIHDIRRAMTKIENEMKRLENKEKELKEDAKRALHNRNKQSALNVLKKKKRVEKEIETKDGQYRQLLDILERIAQSKQNQEVLEAYKAGNKAFKEALGAKGLTVDSVDQTIDSIHEIMEDFKEVDSALSTGFKSTAIDEDELAAELEELMEEDRNAAKKNRVKVNKNVINIGDLPDVPTGNLSADSLEQRIKRLREAV